MHLAIISPFPPAVTGIGQYGYHISGALARLRVFDRLTLLTSRAEGAGAFQSPAGMTVERLWQPGRPDVGWRLAVRLRQLQPGLVWYNLGASAFGRSPLANLSGLLAPWATRLMDLPTVVTLHEMVELSDLRALHAPGGPLAWWGARLITRLTTRADVVCVTLRRHADWLATRRPGLRVVHIPVGSYDPPQCLPEPEAHNLLMFTTFAPFKGLEVLLETFLALHSRYPGLRLTLAGAEHPRAPGYLQGVRRHFGDHPAVHWRGCLPEHALPDLFGQATLVVLPYTATTGSSSVLYRAATWGRAVVASDLPELRAAAVEAGLWVETFSTGSAVALAQAVGRMLDDPAHRLAQVQHNFRVVSRLTLEETSRAYLRAFDLALTGRQGRLPASVPLSSEQESLG